MQSNFRVQVSKDYLVFASAHFITFRGHQCETLHGHNYRVGVAVEGSVDEEAFFVLSGRFRFTVGGEDIEIAPGGFLNIPSGTPHVFSAHPGGGSLLVLWVPGGLEAMFLELARLPSGSIRDPKIRAEISARYDSVPVQP